MTTTLNGINYNFRILVEPFKRNYFFSMQAIHKETRRTSWITTLNLVLNELNIDNENPRFWESDWIVTKKEMERFTTVIKDLVADKEYLNYFERFLNLDRKLLEWENYEQI